MPKVDLMMVPGKKLREKFSPIKKQSTTSSKKMTSSIGKNAHKSQVSWHDAVTNSANDGAPEYPGKGGGDKSGDCIGNRKR